MLNEREGGKREQIHGKETARSDAATKQGWAKRQRESNTLLSKAEKLQIAAGWREQTAKAACKQSTEFLIISRNALLNEVRYPRHPINSSKHHVVRADL